MRRRDGDISVGGRRFLTFEHLSRRTRIMDGGIPIK